MNLIRMLAAGAVAGAALLTAAAPALAQEATLVAADPTSVVLAGNAFSVPDLTIPVGATVTWTNTDPEGHDVVPSDPNFSLDLNFFSPVIDPGTEWSFTFTVPGTYEYFCDLHANMAAVITVVEAAGAADAQVAPAEGAEAAPTEGGDTAASYADGKYDY